MSHQMNINSKRTKQRREWKLKGKHRENTAKKKKKEGKEHKCRDREGEGKQKETDERRRHAKSCSHEFCSLENGTTAL